MFYICEAWVSVRMLLEEAIKIGEVGSCFFIKQADTKNIQKLWS
jgi:hypothetical protein